MKIYKLFTVFALLFCSTMSIVFAEEYYCSGTKTNGSVFAGEYQIEAPEKSCAGLKNNPKIYNSCIEMNKEEYVEGMNYLKRGLCQKPIKKEATYGNTKCKVMYIIENGKPKEIGSTSISIKGNNDSEIEKCVQKARGEVSKTVPAASSTKPVKWADQNLSTQSKPKPVSMTKSGSTAPKTYTKPVNTINKPYNKTYTPTKTSSKPSYQYNFPPQYAPAQNYKNPSDAYKK